MCIDPGVVIDGRQSSRTPLSGPVRARIHTHAQTHTRAQCPRASASRVGALRVPVSYARPPGGYVTGETGYGLMRVRSRHQSSSSTLVRARVRATARAGNSQALRGWTFFYFLFFFIFYVRACTHLRCVQS
jgi:hypothetical protein